MAIDTDMNNDQYQVLIAGAGPAGLLLANFLGRKGISCLLIDKRLNIPRWSRAIGITPPSLAIIKKLDLHHDFARQGVRIQTAYVHDFDSCIGEVKFAEIDSEFNYILALPQADNMKILEKGLEQCDKVVFKQGWKFVDLNSVEDKVEVKLIREKDGKEARVFGKWLVGCDGANSTVRELTEIPFRRRFYRPRFIMADYRDTTDWSDTARLFFSTEGSLESFPLPGKKRRWVAQVIPGTKFADSNYLEQQTKKISNQDIRHSRCSRLFDFTPERLKVDSFYKDRIILAGDAAHVITPIGGQGMNTGFGDIHYLSIIMPKLLQDEGEAHDLLKAYNSFRQKTLRYSRRRTAAGMWLGTRKGASASRLRGLFLKKILLRNPLERWVAKTFAMLKVPQ